MHKILVVDDERLERLALMKMLQANHSNLMLDEASSGRIAIEKALTWQPDIIFMDIKMPGIDGIEAVKQIKGSNQDIQIIMTSAYDTFAYAQEVMRHGVKEYLLKPSRENEVLEALERAIEETKQTRHRQQIPEPLLNQESTGIIEKAKNYMKSHYDRFITLEEVAEHVGLSSFYFSKLFKERCGITFIDYLTALRIEKAKQEVKLGIKSLKEICFDVGYKDPNYFSRVFKKQTGMSPSEYRDLRS